MIRAHVVQKEKEEVLRTSTKATVYRGLHPLDAYVTSVGFTDPGGKVKFNKRD